LFILPRRIHILFTELHSRPCPYSSFIEGIYCYYCGVGITVLLFSDIHSSIPIRSIPVRGIHFDAALFTISRYLMQPFVLFYLEFPTGTLYFWKHSVLLPRFGILFIDYCHLFLMIEFHFIISVRYGGALSCDGRSLIRVHSTCSTGVAPFKFYIHFISFCYILHYSLLFDHSHHCDGLFPISLYHCS